MLPVLPANPTVMEIDAVGTFQMSRCAFPQLRKSPGASIINISATLHYGATWYQVWTGGLGFREAQGTGAPSLKWGCKAVLQTVTVRSMATGS